MNSETVLKDFISSSYELIQDYDKRGRYYHTLTPADNSPTVVHKETNQLTSIIKGAGTVVLNGIEKNICEGDNILINAGMTHRFIAQTDEMILFHIHIPDEGRDKDRYILEGEDYNRFESK